MPVPAHLTAKFGDIPTEQLLRDWQWLLGGSYTPVLMTALGDLFLRDETGQVHFLDLMCGELKQAAASQEDFERLCNDREQARSWFVGYLVTELCGLYGELADGQCYSCKVPLSLGGRLEASNFERADIRVHYSILGQLHRQTRDLPPGTRIDEVRIESPPQGSRPASLWQRLRRWFG
jgi:hypothetical protein